METKISLYVMKAIDAYPYELEKVVESLQYALSYEPENSMALMYMGRLYQEQFNDYEKAKYYFEKALTADLEYLEVYPFYIRALLDNHDIAEAQKLIDFAMSRKGIDKARIYLFQGLLYEQAHEFEKAEDAYNDAMLFAMNSEFIYYMEDQIKRAKNKRDRLNRTKRKEETKAQPEEETKNSWFKDRLNNLL